MIIDMVDPYLENGHCRLKRYLTQTLNKLNIGHKWAEAAEPQPESDHL